MLPKWLVSIKGRTCKPIMETRRYNETGAYLCLFYLSTHCSSRSAYTFKHLQQCQRHSFLSQAKVHFFQYILNIDKRLLCMFSFQTVVYYIVKQGTWYFLLCLLMAMLRSDLQNAVCTHKHMKLATTRVPFLRFKLAVT